MEIAALKIRTPLTVIIFAFSATFGSQVLACKLQDNGDGTMKDSASSILIKRCVEGQSWAGSACTGNAVEVGGDRNLPSYRSGDWRLPTIEEANKLIPAAKGCFGSNSALKRGDTTWTSNRFGDSDSVMYWFVDFNVGYTDNNMGTRHVRLIKSMNR